MNWTEIKTKYPKAFRALQLWFERTYPGICKKADMEWFLKKPNSLRHLFDFFDASKIIVEISHNLNMGKFQCSIFTGEHYYPSQEHLETETRAESEKTAFTKAFEILEIQIS